MNANFIKFTEGKPKPKTKTWLVHTKDDQQFLLGEIKWFGRYRCYSFFPTEYASTVFEKTCLRDIADFCEQQTAAQRKTPCVRELTKMAVTNKGEENESEEVS